MPGLPIFSFNDTVTTTGVPASQLVTGAPVLMSRVPRVASLQVKGVGSAATSWNVVLEGSNDGVNWTAVLTHSSGDGSTIWTGASFYPSTYFRTRVTAVSLSPATGLQVLAVGVD